MTHSRARSTAQWTRSFCFGEQKRSEVSFRGTWAVAFNRYVRRYWLLNKVNKTANPENESLLLAIKTSLPFTVRQWRILERAARQWTRSFCFSDAQSLFEGSQTSTCCRSFDRDWNCVRSTTAASHPEATRPQSCGFRKRSSMSVWKGQQWSFTSFQFWKVSLTMWRFGVVSTQPV